MNVSARPLRVRPTCEGGHRRPNAKQQVRTPRLAAAVTPTALARLRGQERTSRTASVSFDTESTSFLSQLPPLRNPYNALQARAACPQCCCYLDPLSPAEVAFPSPSFHTLDPNNPTSITARKGGGLTQRLRLIVESIGHKLTRTRAVLRLEHSNTPNVTTGLHQRAINSKNVPPLPAYVSMPSPSKRTRWSYNTRHVYTHTVG